MKDAKQVADAMDRFARLIADFSADLKGQVPVGNDGFKDLAPNYDDQDDHDNDGHEVDDDVDFDERPFDGPKVVNLQKGNGPAEETLLQVPAGDLWRLVNRSRKMIRLAREGKIPDLEGRAPLSRAIKALKQKGLVRKPFNLRD